MGVVSPNGIGRKAYADALRAGRSGITAIDVFETTGLKSWAAGQIRDVDLTAVMEPAELRRVPRMVPLALMAAREALDQARLNFAENDLESRRRIGVILGTGGGGLSFAEEHYKRCFTGQAPSLYGITAGTYGNLSSELSIALGLRGMSHVISTGCTSSTDAFGYAMTMIRAGQLPMFLVGGADAPITREIVAGFERMRVISTQRRATPAETSRPFSADRDGFVLSEGAWMFVFEDRDHAERRGATILAEVLGWGSTCDAYHRVQIAPDVVEPVRAIELALADAAVDKAEVNYVNLHGTGTALNDRLETLAIKRVFGPTSGRIPMSSTKSMIGHPQGACGGAGLAATVLMMSEGFIHPTINLENRDEACDLDYVADGARETTIDTALLNCIAFGSKNSALVVRRESLA
ncbi:beta-ketoacyl-[acyl-carrier-protein] synthase family protein [Humisphaera borealis]|uniref:Beta-ketoacyl-[acyl-carrier-protein] synthase family protein n=2 Tax=Humisphaera borealis TaxID=2807512 RepID=A0A7M2X3Q3_9BACT|nr:beta-ketoacyl-[acyl-carrier-protein] synthase family protein [Humisphaera borealis]